MAGVFIENLIPSAGIGHKSRSARSRPHLARCAPANAVAQHGSGFRFLTQGKAVCLAPRRFSLRSNPLGRNRTHILSLGRTCSYPLSYEGICLVFTIFFSIIVLAVDDETKLLKRILTTVEENNRVVRNLQRAMRWGRFFRILYWVVIIGAMLGAFYFLQPVIDQLKETYGVLPNVTDVLGK